MIGRVVRRWAFGEIFILALNTRASNPPRRGTSRNFGSSLGSLVRTPDNLKLLSPALPVFLRPLVPCFLSRRSLGPLLRVDLSPPLSAHWDFSQDDRRSAYSVSVPSRTIAVVRSHSLNVAFDLCRSGGVRAPRQHRAEPEAARRLAVALVWRANLDFGIVIAASAVIFELHGRGSFSSNAPMV